MPNEIKRTISYGTTGVLIAAVIIAGFVAGNYLLRPVKGTLTIQIIDKPVELKHLNMIIDRVEIQDQDANWHDLTLVTEPFYFDLLALQTESATLSF